MYTAAVGCLSVLQIKVQEVLGKGAFGTTFRAHWRGAEVRMQAGEWVGYRKACKQAAVRSLIRSGKAAPAEL